VNNFFTRTITGVLFVVIIVGSAMWNFGEFAVLFGVFTIFGTFEFYKLIEKLNVKPYKITGTLIGLLVYLISILNSAGIIEKQTNLLFLSLFALSIFIFIFELFRKSDTPFQNIAFTFLGIIYVSVPFSLLVSLANYKAGNTGVLTFPIFYFFIIWTYDTFAYLVGIKFGKNRMYERISPKKSWEGAIGGLIFTLIITVILSKYFNFLSLIQWLGLALIIVVFGTLGDLVESMLKRNANSKDSGKFFPGHGGILDRFDSLLLSVPFVYIYLRILELV
jgi:phosphatidate cytidylyltransferase